MPRFALLEHDHPVLHWDLLLEGGEACRTWRLAAPLDAAATIPAEALPNHRPLYLDYEGPVSGDRGVVRRWDAGRFVWITATEDQVVVLLTGARWSGRVDLQRDANGWQAKLGSEIPC